jgi:hypothetical protein
MNLRSFYWVVWLTGLGLATLVPNAWATPVQNPDRQTVPSRTSLPSPLPPTLSQPTSVLPSQPTSFVPTQVQFSNPSSTPLRPTNTIPASSPFTQPSLVATPPIIWTATAVVGTPATLSTRIVVSPSIATVPSVSTATVGSQMSKSMPTLMATGASSAGELGMPVPLCGGGLFVVLGLILLVRTGRRG